MLIQNICMFYCLNGYVITKEIGLTFTIYCSLGIPQSHLMYIMGPGLDIFATTVVNGGVDGTIVVWDLDDWQTSIASIQVSGQSGNCKI